MEKKIVKLKRAIRNGKECYLHKLEPSSRSLKITPNELIEYIQQITDCEGYSIVIEKEIKQKDI